MKKLFALFVAAVAGLASASADTAADGFVSMGLCDYSRPAYRASNYNKKPQWADSLQIQVKAGDDGNTYRVMGAYGDAEPGYMEFTTHVDAQGRTLVTVPRQECTGMSYTGSGIAVPMQLSTVDVWVQAMKDAGDQTYTEEEMQALLDEHVSYYDQEQGRFVMWNVYWLPEGQRYSFMYTGMDEEYVELQGWKFQNCWIEVNYPEFKQGDNGASLKVDVKLYGCGSCRLMAAECPADGMTAEALNAARTSLVDGAEAVTVTENGVAKLPLESLTKGRKYVVYALWQNDKGEYRTNHNGYVTSFDFYTFEYTGSTGIDEVTEGAGASRIYNLQGMRIDAEAGQLPAGIYIIDGKKVAVRR